MSESVWKFACSFSCLARWAYKKLLCANCTFNLLSEFKGENSFNAEVSWKLFQNPADIDNLGADIEYFPEQSFASYYYPYLNQKGYLSPLMFVKFNSVERNVAVMVECRAWAKNIRYDRTEKEGGVHFELLLDPWQIS